MRTDDLPEAVVDAQVVDMIRLYGEAGRFDLRLELASLMPVETMDAALKRLVRRGHIAVRRGRSGFSRRNIYSIPSTP